MSVLSSEGSSNPGSAGLFWIFLCHKFYLPHVPPHSFTLPTSQHLYGSSSAWQSCYTFVAFLALLVLICCSFASSHGICKASSWKPVEWFKYWYLWFMPSFLRSPLCLLCFWSATIVLIFRKNCCHMERCHLQMIFKHRDAYGYHTMA